MANNIPVRFKEYVVTNVPKMIEVSGHYRPTPFWITPEMFPDVKIRVAGLEVSKIVGVPHADPHVHEFPEVYLAPSEKKGEIVVEIQMDDESFEVESPFAVFIPQGIKHRFKVLKCESPHYVLGIMMFNK